MKQSYEDFTANFFTVVSKSGSEWNCKCPWHDDNSPSLRINIESGLFLCNGCGRKGHLKRVAKDEGIDVAMREVNVLDYVLKAIAPERRERVMSEGFLTPLCMTTDYWETVRKITPATVKKFKLGQDLVRHTATIPLRTEYGELLGLCERQLGGMQGPKYHYPFNYKKNHHLFGTWMLEPDHDTVCIVEGPIDAIAMWDVGIPAVALSGSSMSARQVKVLRQLDIRNVVLFTDNDEAGTHAIEQMIESLTGTGVLWSLARYRSDWGKDPAALTPGQRRSAFKRAVTQFDVTID